MWLLLCGTLCLKRSSSHQNNKRWGQSQGWWGLNSTFTLNRILDHLYMHVTQTSAPPMILNERIGISHVYNVRSHLPDWTKVSSWVSGGYYTSLPNMLIMVEKSKWELTWFNDFSSRVLHNNLPPIQVFDQKLAATQRLHQPNLVVYEQVISISLERLTMRKTLLIQPPMQFGKNTYCIWGLKKEPNPKTPLLICLKQHMAESRGESVPVGYFVCCNDDGLRKWNDFA